ncbi:low density lipoprotein receptor adapter protein 1-B-like [Mytilus californianus]|uniref:low density lipoprotein receptor adapter protein 1-B-like n=1 Tax=Mytilus californianus TaxID=6549 RepID=UPI002245D43A|nr:low density lipoprotein receptor adapter protein 1-B-like [Mytilus californianus]XP_052087435.1 low density lipoprotein receptor adapter protein 1-B-like [Mytilus californianus]
MDMFRKIKPKNTKSIEKHLGHEKLGEGWSENKEAVTDGLTFHLKYIGSTLIEEAADGQSYRDGQSEKAVNNIVAMAKTAKSKLRKVTLTTSPEGMKVLDMASKELLIECSIFRISFCSADKNHEKIFAFMARNSINETMECHAFLCAKRKIAQAVTLTVSKAFELASEKWNTENENKNSNETAQSRLEDNNFNNSTTYSSKRDGNNSPIPKLQSPKSVNRSSPTPKQSKEWLKFEDDNLDDDFSRLAENRIRKVAEGPPRLDKIPSFHTNLKEEDMDDSITKYLDTKTCNEEFSRQRSMEDLLVI